MGRIVWMGVCLVSVLAGNVRAEPPKPTTAAEAFRVIDLATFPLLEGAKAPGHRSRTHLMYEAKGDVDGGMKFLRKELGQRQWKELPESYAGKESANTAFGRDGFRLSVAVSQFGMPDTIMVHMVNHGNVDLKSLPVLPGAKSSYVGATSVNYTTDITPAAATEAYTKLLAEKGWSPYGDATNQHFFKQNAVRLSAYIHAAPEGGTTHIQLTSEQLAADLPVPPAVKEFHYSDMPTQLSFDTKTMSVDEVADFYRQAMTPAGWNATTDKPVKDKRTAFLIFRNADKDMLSLDMETFNQLIRVRLKHQTAAEVAEAAKRFDAAQEAKKKEKAKPLPQVIVTLPDAAKEVKDAKNRIEFKLATGAGQAAVETLRKTLRDDGWTEKVVMSDKKHGHFTLTKEKQEVTINFIDPGFIPAEVTIRARNAELQKGAPH